MGRDIHSPPRLELSLQRWHRMLDDTKERRDLPDLYRSNLHELADQLLAAGIIDPLERFDLGELADAAYYHEVEEQILLYRYFQRGGYYDLMHGDQRVGTLRSVRLYWGERDTYWPAEYDAWITHTDAGLEAVTRSTREVIGRIDGKRYLATSGKEYELVETARIIGRDRHAIDDPDVYRAALDAIQHAAEQGDTKRHASLVQRASVSVFMPCPVCEDRFGQREDCAECEGRGFVRETPERFRWRS